MRFWAALSFSILLSFQVSAKSFKSQFIRLELPPNWDCKQEELDWVCQPDNVAERSEVILIVVTKPVDEVDDSMEKYEAILKNPKKMRDLLGNAYTSQVKYTSRKAIKDHPWMDSLHYGSEIPGFFTRYVVSTKEKIAGLVTYSIAETVYPKWSEIMDKVIGSLDIYFDPKAFAEAMKQGSGSLLGARGARAKRMAPSLEEVQEEAKKSDGSTAQAIIALLVAAGAIGYIVWKRKQKKS
jgi:hypothetical protein